MEEGQRDTALGTRDLAEFARLMKHEASWSAVGAGWGAHAAFSLDFVFIAGILARTDALE
jgi:hypothetical protein